MEKSKSPSLIIVLTAIKTLVAIVLILALALLATGIAAPAVTGDFFHALGMNGISVSYAKTAYGRSGDVNDLATVIDRAIGAGLHDVVTEFAPIMLAHRQYYAYCAHTDAVTNSSLAGVTAFSYDRYLRGNYALSLASTGDVTSALAVCRAFMRFDQDGLAYHGIASYYLIAANGTLPDGLEAFLARANEVKVLIDDAVANETEPVRIAKLTAARLDLYSEINGILTLLGQSTADWSLE